MINLKNYEEFALDYLEGNLPSEQRRDFEAFLKTEPEIEAEVLAMTEILTASADESIIYENKERLLKEEEGAKIIVLNTRFWYRASIAVAAIGLLFIGYLLGFPAPFSGAAAQIPTRPRKPPALSRMSTSRR